MPAEAIDGPLIRSSAPLCSRLVHAHIYKYGWELRLRVESACWSGEVLDIAYNRRVLYGGRKRALGILVSVWRQSGTWPLSALDVICVRDAAVGETYNVRCLYVKKEK